MARYSIHLMLASLHIQDTPISYNSPRGLSPDFKVVYNQREANQPTTFNYSNLGPKWTFNWLSYVTDDGPAGPSANPMVYVRGGGTEVFGAFNSGTQSYASDRQTLAVLVRTSSNTYEKRFPNGSKEVFAQSDGATSSPRRVFLTSVVDAASNATTFTYDGNLRITAITDSLGQATTLTYGLTGDQWKISKVTDPFGRFATFEYTSGQLTKITDPAGIESRFEYESGTDFINMMITPYGQTTFAKGETGTSIRWLEATDPRGGKERVEYNNAVSSIASTEASAPVGVYNNNLQFHNTFYWDKKAMADAPGDYSQAQIFHWLAMPEGKVSGIKHSEKKALENRVWYIYEDQSDPANVGKNTLPIETLRVVGGGTVQYSQYSYNGTGNLLAATDPAGRVKSYVYDTNNIDVLSIYQRNPAGASIDPGGQAADKIAVYTYNSLHERLTETDAAGQTTNYVYNSSGQILTRTNAKSEITTYTYGGGTVPAGYLASITSPQFNGVSAVTSFGYDSSHRVRTVTNQADQYTVTTDYDNIDRKTIVTYPDGSYEQFQYVQDFGQGQGPKVILDMTASRDRVGRWTYRHYNGNRQMDSITDPANSTTLYGWCTCGSMTSITDPNGNVTTFNRDIQSRVYQKAFDDSTTIDYLFDGQTAPNTPGATSRLKSSTDALNRRTNYSYFLDDNINSVSYTDASGGPLLPPTPSVSYTYDPNYNRTATMTDGTGTTNYAYYPITSTPALGAGQLQAIDGPLSNDAIAFTYDELGRTVGQSVNGVARVVAYDSLGRLTATDNALGHFSRVYYGVTPRLQTLSYPNGQATNYTYAGNHEDPRLQTLENLDSGAATLSRFDYVYHADGHIRSWNKLLGSDASDLSLSYDDAGQLTGVSRVDQEIGYQYDASGNRIADSVVDSNGWFPNGTFHTYTPNNLNQIESVQGTENGAVIINGGLLYDLVGNLTDDGQGKTFEWDAANRLIAISYVSGERTEFGYDGLGRRVKITEYGPGVTAVIQPSGSEYSTFSTTPFPVSSGSYTLTFEGLNGNGEAVALIDSVTLNGTLVENGSFESPDVSSSHGGYEYAPGGATWGFSGDAGIAANRSDFSSGTPDAPDGTQVGFIQDVGQIFQTRNISGGSYTLSFQAAQQGGLATIAGPQQLRVTLKLSTGAVRTKAFVWCGNQICEERDSSGATVTKRFFAEGEKRIGGSDAGNYYYSRDHLGSIREVTDSNGVLQARYDYDPYGKPVVVAGNMNVDFGYTGHYFHAPSGLNLTLYRAYNPTLGRWLSRDPIGEASGINLYQYVTNSPVTKIDRLGLAGEPTWTKILAQIGNILGAADDFWRAYQDMREANTIGADKYFHCLANCRAATNGLTIPILFSVGREISDTITHIRQPIDSLRDSFDDMRADRHGWNCPVPESCEERCARYRPAALPPQY